VSGRLLGVDVVAAVEVDVGVQRPGEACEIDVVERPASGAFTLDDLWLTDAGDSPRATFRWRLYSRPDPAHAARRKRRLAPRRGLLVTATLPAKPRGFHVLPPTPP
jgi:hypothetical protein